MTRAVRGVLGAAGALHLTLLAYFYPLRLLTSKLPILEYDYALHAYQVSRALSAYEASGRLWSYDPLVLAGQPAGAVEDLTSKSLEAFAIAAHALGVDPWLAFDVYILAAHLCLLPVAWVTARLFGFDRLAAAITVLLWVLAWHADSFLHWCWYIGMISWGAASYLCVLVVALAYRALRDGRAGAYAAMVAATALVTFVHPFAAFTLALPLGAVFVRAFPRLRAWERAAVLASIVAAGLTSLAWIGPALRFRHYIGPVDAFLWPSPSYALFDFLDLLKDLAMTGEPVRTALRSLLFVLAAVGLVRLHRQRDDRVLPLATLLVVSVAEAYLSGYSTALRQTQPYRHIAPATLVAALVAASTLPSLLRASGDRLGRDARVALALGALVAVPYLARTLVGYLPALLPRREHARTAFRPGPFASGSSDERDPPFMGHSPAPADYRAVANVVATLTAGSGRVATVDWVLGEYLPTFANLPTLGGIAERNVPHVAAHPLRRDFKPSGAGDDPVARYLADYAVRAVVTENDAPFFDSRTDLLEPSGTVGPYRIYRTRRPATFFARGTGRVVEQAVDRIRVADAAGDPIVLRFHYMETLRCRPACKVRRAAGPDAVGFIEVENAPASFEIYNGG